MNFKLTARQRRLAALKVQANASEEGVNADKVYTIAMGDFAHYAEFFEKNHLEEFLIEEKGTRILFRSTQYAQAGAAAAHRQPAASPSDAGMRAEELSAGQENPQDAGGDAAAPAAASTVTKVLSPLNGTFYNRPSPDTNPFVTVGSVVTPESVICLIEAMKIYNEIKAENAGRIIKVLVENAESVKEGQELFWIE